MFKTLRSVSTGAKSLLKYASIALVILSIVGYAAKELEKWLDDNEPIEKKQNGAV
jgi:hypothetical protein